MVTTKKITALTVLVLGFCLAPIYEVNAANKPRRNRNTPFISRNPLTNLLFEIAMGPIGDTVTNVILDTIGNNSSNLSPSNVKPETLSPAQRSPNLRPEPQPIAPRNPGVRLEPQPIAPRITHLRPDPQPEVTKPSSSQAVKDYYSILNRGEYSKTWGLLSPEFRRRYSENSFSSYKSWWNKVDRIAVGQTKLISQGENQAIVEVGLTYDLKDGRSIGDHKRFSLIFDNDTNNWVIDDDLGRSGTGASKSSVNGTNATVVGKTQTKNIRSGAGTDYKILGEIRKGRRIKVISTGRDKGNYRWYKIYDPSSGIQGWMAAQLVSRD